MPILEKVVILMRKPLKNFENKANDHKYLYYLAAVAIFAVALGMYFNTGISYYNEGDMYVRIYSSHIISIYGMKDGIAYLTKLGGEVWDAFFPNEYLLIGIPALFYRVLGINATTVSLYGTISLVGTIVVLFYIGKRLGNGRVGIISAAVFACIPAVLLELGSGGDGLPVAFFSSAAVLSVIEAGRTGNNYYYLMPGVLIAIGAMAGSVEVLITLLFLFLLLLYRAAKSHDAANLRGSAVRFTFFILGALAGLFAILFCGQAFAGSYYAFFGAEVGHAPINTYFIQYTMPFVGVLEGLFPTYYSYSYMYFWIWPYSALNPSESTSILSPYGITEAGSPRIVNVIGFFGYAMLVCAVYLAYRRSRGVGLPATWIAVVIGYLSFGISGNLNGFIALDPRLFIAAMPPLALIIGLGADDMLTEVSKYPRFRARLRAGDRRRLALKMVFYACITVFALLVFTTAIYLVQFYNNTYASELYPWVQTGKFISTLPKNATVYVVSTVFYNAPLPPRHAPISMSAPLRFVVSATNCQSSKHLYLSTIV